MDRLAAGLFHGGLDGENCVSGIPRNLWVVYLSDQLSLGPGR